MEFSFVPKRLIKEKEDIVLIHDNVGTPQISREDDSLRELIERLAGLELYQVRKTANTLTEKECGLVAAYIPTNYYSVDLSNLFKIFQYRTNSRMCDILYSSWQDSYENKECNDFMKDLLVTDEPFIMLIQKNSLTEGLFTDFLSSESIPIRFGEELKSRVFKTAKTLKEKMALFGIRDDSMLFHTIQFLFFTFCDREDYLAVDQTVLLDVIRKYNNVEIKKFVINFVSKLSLTDLEKYESIANYLNVNVTGDPNSNRFSSFFAGIKQDVVTKYTDWINIYKVNKYFGYDERSMFWKQYRFINIKPYRQSNSVVMEMKDYYATEFLGDAMGPIYFYKKDVFDNSIRRWFEREDNHELRSTLYNTRDKYASYRKAHQGYWQREIHNILISNRMTERIKY